MSINRVFVDRMSGYPNRYRMVPATGTPSYITLERADEPTTPGTPLNAETLNGLIADINAMETEVKAYADTKVAETVVVAQYASAKGSAETLALPQGDITPLALDTWGTKSGDNFTFAEGGMVMPTSGVVLVLGAVYFNTSSPTKPEELGVYLKKNGEEVCGQKSYCIGATTVHMSPVTLEVEEGDILHLCARNTTLDENKNYVDGSCIPNSRHTSLTVYYLTGGGSVISGGSGNDGSGSVSPHPGVSGGSLSEEQIAAAVEAYFAEHPVSGGSAVRVAEVELISANWVGDASPYSQIVNIPGITRYSQVDLTPSVEQLTIFHDKDLSFVTENEEGVVTVYAIGDKPLNDYTMQVTIKEVSVSV